MNQGKTRRLKRIMQQDNRTVIVPMDHGVTIGPIQGITNMQQIINQLLKGGVDAVLVHKGIAKHVDVGNAGLIVQLSGMSNLSPNVNGKVQVCSVQEAIRLGRRRSFRARERRRARRGQNAKQPWAKWLTNATFTECRCLR